MRVTEQCRISIDCQTAGHPTLWRRQARRRIWSNGMLRSLIVFMVSFVPAWGAESLVSDADTPVRLPTYSVTADLEGYDQEFGWRHCSLPGLEVLAKGRDGRWEGIIRELQVFRYALERIWPDTLTRDQLPAAIVLCDDPSDFRKFIPGSTVKQSAGAPRGGKAVGGTQTRSLSEGDQALIVSLHTVYTGREAEAVKAAYASAILDRIEDRVPAWLNRGLLKAFMGMSCTGPEIRFPAFKSNATRRLRAAGKAEDLETALKAGKFYTLEQFFAAEKAPAEEVPGSGPMDQRMNLLYDGPWSNQSYEFVHLCVFGAGGKYREPFFRLADLASKQPIDDTTFRSLFGMGLRDMLLVLWRYTDCSRTTKFKITTDENEIEGAVFKPEFHDATDAEFSRIRGETLLAGRWRGAHHAFIAAYLRGARDPELLAALGIQESVFGKDLRALKFLEAAASAQTTRGRAYLELARLRCKAALVEQEGRGKRLTASQVQAVWVPLSTAIKLPPAMPEPYRLLTALWANAAIRPTATDLSTIRQGVSRFPLDTDLAYNAALVHSQHGYVSDAAELVEFGLRMARNEKDRERLKELRTFLK